MWPWLKRWRDWAISELWPMYRIRPQPQALHFSYEKAGLVASGPADPVERGGCRHRGVAAAAAVDRPAQDRLQPRASPARTRSSPSNCVCNETRRRLSRLTSASRLRAAATARRVVVPRQVLGRIDLPFLSRDEFLQGLRLQMPTLFVRMGEAHGCLRNVRGHAVPRLAGRRRVDQPDEPGTAARSGLAGRVPRRTRGAPARAYRPDCAVPNSAAGRLLVTVVLQAAAAADRHLEGDVAARRSGPVRAAEGARHLAEPLPPIAAGIRHALRGAGQARRSAASVPANAAGRSDARGCGPCFLVSSGEKGMAGICRFQAAAQVHGRPHRRPPMEQEVLITDGPTMVAPGTFAVAET